MLEKIPIKSLSLLSIKSIALGWGMVLAFVAFNSFGTLTIKTQVQNLGIWNFDSFKSVVFFFFALFSSWTTWIGLGSISIATLAWIIALAHLELSKAYPAAIGFNLLIIVGMSLFYFHESLTFAKILGTLLIFSGVVFLFK